MFLILRIFSPEWLRKNKTEKALFVELRFIYYNSITERTASEGNIWKAIPIRIQK